MPVIKCYHICYILLSVKDCSCFLMLGYKSCKHIHTFMSISVSTLLLVFHPRSHFALCIQCRYEFGCTRSKFFIVHNAVFDKEYFTLLVHIAVVFAEKQEIRSMAHFERKYSDIYLDILGRGTQWVKLVQAKIQPPSSKHKLNASQLKYFCLGVMKYKIIFGPAVINTTYYNNA